MPIHRIHCSDIAELRKKYKLAMSLYKGEASMDVRAMAKGTLQARDGDLVFATAPLPMAIWKRIAVYTDGSLHDVDLSKSEGVKLWIYVTIHQDNEVR